MARSKNIENMSFAELAAMQARCYLEESGHTERDLAGYIVLRGQSQSDLQPMMPSPITATTFKDDLAPGTRHVYAIRAVDKAGNMSASSNLVEETAR